jgi:acyl dehydratase
MIVPQHFEDIEIGAERTSFGRTITETDFVVHAGHTGDFFPHHMDAAWCATQPIGQRIAHGTMVFAIGIGLTATTINPHAMSYGYDRLRFIRPVHIGDTLTTITRIADKRDHSKRAAQGIVTETVDIRNQHGDTVLACDHLYLVDRRADV